MTCLCFVGGFLIKPKTNKLISLVFLSTGSITYVPTTIRHKMFCLTQLKNSLSKRSQLVEQSQFMHKYAQIEQSFSLIKHLPKNQPVSLLEILPNKGVQYARSTGVSAKIVKMDSRISTSLVKLPSGVKKVFSTFSIGSEGSVALPEHKK